MGSRISKSGHFLRATPPKCGSVLAFCSRCGFAFFSSHDISQKATPNPAKCGLKEPKRPFGQIKSLGLCICQTILVGPGTTSRCQEGQLVGMRAGRDPRGVRSYSGWPRNDRSIFPPLRQGADQVDTLRSAREQYTVQSFASHHGPRRLAARMRECQTLGLCRGFLNVRQTTQKRGKEVYTLYI